MSRPLRRHGGFTLIEMVVAMAVSTILTLGIAAALPSFIKLHTRSIDVQYAGIICDSIGEALKNELAFAAKVEVRDGGSTLVYLGSYGEKTVDGNGAPPLIEGLAYDPRYYLNHQVALRFDLNGEVCTVSIEVGNQNGEPLKNAERAIRLYGLPTVPAPAG